MEMFADFARMEHFMQAAMRPRWLWLAVTLAAPAMSWHFMARQLNRNLPPFP